MATTPIGTLEFFKLEAGEYLERLGALAGRAGGPGPDELVRYARALRGSALMAQQAQIGRAAASLEAIGRGMREGRLTWDPVLAETVGSAVDDLKGLLREVTAWGPDQDTRSARVTEGLLGAAGPTPAPEVDRPALDRRHDPGPDQGVRAFVARETSLIAGALERASRALAASSADRAVLPVVLRRMQSLRGLASLADLPPLPEVLDGIERTVADLGRRQELPTGTPEVLASGAQVLHRISSEVSGTGRPDVNSPEATEFARQLIDVLLRDPGVVRITSLAPAGAHPVAAAGRVPVAAITSLEFVGHGEYLAQAADDLERAATAASRGLRLFALAGVLQAGARPDTSGVGDSLAALLDRVIEASAAIDRPLAPDFLGMLRAAGRCLREAGGSPDPSGVGAALRRIVGESAPQAVSPTPQAAAAPPSLARPVATDGVILPIHALLAEAEPSPSAPGSVVPIATLMLEGPDLAGTLATLARLRSATRPSDTPARRAEPIDVRRLLFRGASAVERARQVASDLRAHRSAGSAWEPLLEELLDLLPLTAEEAR